jgi:antitoxin component YwqK of YwqJK toxin-antitoxin module
MKPIIISAFLVVFCSFALTANAQDGFTNKAEARNEYKDGLKTGKWFVYLDKDLTPTTDTEQASYYCLAVYRGGKPSGKMRQYDLTGKLVYENVYRDGKLNDMRSYHQNGRLYLETPYSDGKKNGLSRTYYENGILMCETPYTAGNKYGTEKVYYENGKIKCETPYVNGNKHGRETIYEDNGDVKKQIDYVNGKICEPHQAKKSVIKKKHPIKKVNKKKKHK